MTTKDEPKPSPWVAAAKIGTESKTLWQSIIATALWSVAQAYGVLIPYEALVALILAIGGKEAAGKFRAPVKPKDAQKA